MSFLVSFEVVEIIFFFLDFEDDSFSSSRFLLWDDTDMTVVVDETVAV